MSYSHSTSHDSHLIKKLKDVPLLTAEEEKELTTQWVETQNAQACDKLIIAHLRLVAKVAKGYRGYGLPLSDLISEGNIGMMHAMRHFDPSKGFRLSSYAIWWIRAYIQSHILHSWSMVRIGKTNAQRKLFFRLNKTRQSIKEAHDDDEMTPEMVQAIAIKLKVKPEEVIHMAQRLTKDSSLNISYNDDSGDKSSEWIDWIPDERDNQEIAVIQQDEIKRRKELFDEALTYLTPRQIAVLTDRRLTEPPLTLEAVAKKYDISRERARQIEQESILKLSKVVKKLSHQCPTHI